MKKQWWRRERVKGSEGKKGERKLGRGGNESRNKRSEELTVEMQGMEKVLDQSNGILETGNKRGLRL